MRPVIGIDPGLDGGLACIDSAGLLIEVMPTLGATGKRDLDIPSILRLLRGWRDTLGARNVYLEKVGARPSESPVACFRFGEGVGILKGLAVSLDLAITEVLPQTWHKVICAGMPAGDPKGNAVKRAAQLYPRVSFLATQRSRVPHSGMCDAALIASHGLREINGIGGGR